MKKSDLERTYKIKTHSINIIKAIQNLTLDEFKSESGIDARDACAFRLFQIGEHSHKLSDELKEQYPDYEWGGAYRFRNVLGHDYESVSYNAIWKSCKNDVPKLLAYIEKIISEIEPELDLPDPPPNHDKPEIQDDKSEKSNETKTNESPIQDCQGENQGGFLMQQNKINSDFKYEKESDFMSKYDISARVNPLKDQSKNVKAMASVDLKNAIGKTLTDMYKNNERETPKQEGQEKPPVMHEIKAFVTPLRYSKNSTKGLATVQVGDMFKVNSIRINESSKDGANFVAMPSRPDKSAESGYRDVIHPVNKEFGETLKSAVLKQYDSQLAWKNRTATADKVQDAPRQSRQATNKSAHDIE